ncbi:hypothetical protein E8Q24_04850 [Salmonella enterica]|nr:hypothetical protein [Salmonella enterica subsp. enterica serovar Dahomey]
MIKIALFLIPFFLLSGCASEVDMKAKSVNQAKTLQQKRDALLSYSSKVGWSADIARERYLKNGVENDAFLSNLIETCKASEYRSCVKKFYEDSANKKEEEKRSKCLSDQACKKDLIISESVDDLNNKYFQLINYNSYQTGDADYFARMVCDAISNNQKFGMPFGQTESVVRGISGVDPFSREMLVGIGDACWKLSYYGYKNPMSTLRPWK